MAGGPEHTWDGPWGGPPILKVDRWAAPPADSAAMEQAIVVGGAMGGLAAALALLQTGLFRSVQVYEQNARMTTAGAGILVSPNGARIMHGLGVDLRGEVGKAARLKNARGVRRNNTLIVGEKDFDHDGYGDGAGFHHMHRADLLACLAARVAELAPRIQVHLGKQLVSLEQDSPAPGRVTVGFADGTTAVGDLVIGADGIHSRVLELQWPDAKRERWTEVSCFRGLIPRAKVASLGLDHPQIDSPTMDTRELPNARCLTYWVRRGELLNCFFGWYEPGAAPSEYSEGDHHPVSHEEMQSRAAQIYKDDPRCGDVLKLLGAMEDPIQWGLYDRDALESWHEGRMVLLGDAAHPMLPSLAQGVNQAFEDAGALGACLKLHGAHELERALLHYERVRHFRAGRFQHGSMFMLRALDPPVSALRARLLAEVNEREQTAFDARQVDDRDSWMYAFDAREVGEMPLRKLGPWDFRARNPIKGEFLDSLWTPPPQEGGKKEKGPLPTVTRREVARHNSMADSWVIIRNKVYDWTEWNAHHPGGSFVSKLYAGKDATAEFGEFHSPEAQRHMAHFLVAELVDEEKAPVSWTETLGPAARL